MAIIKKDLELHGLRGATTTQSNKTEAIEASVTELIMELIKRNELQPDQIISIIFTVTSDLNACFPAAIARRQPGWGKVALIDCQQMYVKGDLKKCIRILAHVLLPVNQVPKHAYLGEAVLLRPDRSINN